MCSIFQSNATSFSWFSWTFNPWDEGSSPSRPMICRDFALKQQAGPHDARTNERLVSASPGEFGFVAEAGAKPRIKQALDVARVPEAASV